MKKIISLVVAFLFVASFCWARDVGFPSRGDLILQTASIINDPTLDVGHTHVSTSPSLIWRVTITASAANTYVQILDGASTGTYTTVSEYISAKAAPTLGGNKKVKADLGAATANQSYVYDFDPPIRCEEGIFVGLVEPTGNGVGLLNTTAVTAVIQYSPAE